MSFQISSKICSFSGTDFVRWHADKYVRHFKTIVNKLSLRFLNSVFSLFNGKQRSVFRINLHMSNIYDGAFLRKRLTFLKCEIQELIFYSTGIPPLWGFVFFPKIYSYVWKIFWEVLHFSPQLVNFD